MTLHYNTLPITQHDTHANKATLRSPKQQVLRATQWLPDPKTLYTNKQEGEGVKLDCNEDITWRGQGCVVA